MRFALAVTILAGCATARTIPMTAFPAVDFDTHGAVTDEDLTVATVRVLAAHGFVVRGRRHGLGAVAAQWDARAGLIMTEWLDVEPREYLGTTWRDVVVKVPRKHSIRVVLREGTLTFAIDCVEQDRGLWRACRGDERNADFVDDVRAVPKEILREAKRRADKRKAATPEAPAVPEVQ